MSLQTGRSFNIQAKLCGLQAVELRLYINAKGARKHVLILPLRTVSMLTGDTLSYNAESAAKLLATQPDIQMSTAEAHTYLNLLAQGLDEHFSSDAYPVSFILLPVQQRTWFKLLVANLKQRTLTWIDPQVISFDTLPAISAHVECHSSA